MLHFVSVDQQQKSVFAIMSSSSSTYKTTSLDDIFASMQEVSKLYLRGAAKGNDKVINSLQQWSAVLRVIDKMKTWKLRLKAADKVYEMLNELRFPKLSLAAWKANYHLWHCIANWFVFAHNLGPLYDYNEHIVKKMVSHFEQESTKKLPVIITMTSCKRLDLLTRTINSMLVNCLDITSFVREWIIIDDNSSDYDRAKMKQMYPFMKFIDKTPDQKGHPRSMNMLREYLITTDALYNWHLEDDWDWWFPDQFITKCINVIGECNNSVGQALVNFEYGEDPYQSQAVWNREMSYTNQGVRYFIHEYYTGARLAIEQNQLGGLSSMYWPHFSFRVGITKLDVYRQVGDYNEQAAHFEMEFANRYVAAGYKSAMLDCCYTTHMGRRTYERNTSKLNAYDLNQEQQFGSAPKPLASIAKDVPKQASNEVANKEKQATNEVETDKQEGPSNSTNQTVTPVTSIVDNSVCFERSDITHIQTYVINLDRRPERLLEFIKKNNQSLPSFEIFSAVDGQALKPNIKIHKMFETSDYNYRRGIVGCAYSHIKIWSQFVHSSADFCVVLEDDVTVSFTFKDKLMHLITTYRGQYDLMFLHWNPYGHVVNIEEWNREYVKPIAELWSTQKSQKDNMGSGAAYILTRHGAKHLLKWVNVHGMPNGVDWVMFKQQQLKIMYSKPMIAYAPCWNHNTNINSDIQRMYDCVRYNDIFELLREELERWYTQIYKLAGHTTKQNKCTVAYVDCRDLQDQLQLAHNAKSMIAVAVHAKQYWDGTMEHWKSLKHRVVVVSQDVECSNSLPVHWYTVGSYKIIVPDRFISKEVYEEIPWSNNRMNFCKA